MTDAEAAAILKSTTDNVEAMYNTLVQTSRSASILLQNDKAYCNELRQYNLYAMGTYQWQLSMIQSAKALGVQNVPAAPKFPTLFKIAGQSGQDSLNIQCSKLSGLGGLNDDGTVKREAIEVVTSDAQLLNPNAPVPTFNVDPNQVFAKVPGLGIEPITVVVIVLVGVLITIGLAYAIKFVEALTGQGIEKERTQQAKLQIAAFNSTITARSDCFNKCLQTGQPASDCAKTCEAAFKADIPSIPGGYTTMSVIGVAAVAIGAFWLWGKRKKIAGAGRRFVSDEGDDEDPIELTRSMRRTRGYA